MRMVRGFDPRQVRLCGFDPRQARLCGVDPWQARPHEANMGAGAFAL